MSNYELSDTEKKRLKKANKIVDKFLNCEHDADGYTECCCKCGENVYTTPDEIRKREMRR